jgi:hypothetical protein
VSLELGLTELAHGGGAAYRYEYLLVVATRG